MNDDRVWELLRRGGGGPTGAEAGGPVRFAKYNGLLDPAGAEDLGGALAAELAGHRVDLVVVWEDVEDAVLGFVVARHLGVPVVRTYNADGLVEHVGPIPSGGRAVLVTDAPRDGAAARAVRALLARRGGELLGVAALLDPPKVGDEPALASLVRIAPDPAAPGGAEGGR